MYRCAWSPHQPALLAAATADGAAHILDTRGGPRPVASLPVGGEALGVDWNKYRPMTLATGGTDRTVKVWDARGAAAPTDAKVLTGHQYAVRGVAWSPYHASVLASVSYDMTARIWNTDDASVAAQVPSVLSARQVYTGHREFATGVAWALFEPGMVATASWDMEVHVWPAIV